jgi:hypothetical protein
MFAACSMPWGQTYQTWILTPQTQKTCAKWIGYTRLKRIHMSTKNGKLCRTVHMPPWRCKTEIEIQGKVPPISTQPNYHGTKKADVRTALLYIVKEALLLNLGRRVFSLTLDWSKKVGTVKFSMSPMPKLYYGGRRDSTLHWYFYW